VLKILKVCRCHYTQKTEYEIKAHEKHFIIRRFLLHIFFYRVDFAVSKLKKIAIN